MPEWYAYMHETDALKLRLEPSTRLLATAETGSFSAAARVLNLTQPTLGRQVAAFEQSLELVLFERIGRKLELTPAGRDLLDELQGMGDAANRASLVASGRGQSVAGDVYVSTTNMFAYYVMPQIVADLQKIAHKFAYGFWPQIPYLTCNAVRRT